MQELILKKFENVAIDCGYTLKIVRNYVNTGKGYFIDENTLEQNLWFIFDFQTGYCTFDFRNYNGTSHEFYVRYESLKEKLNPIVEFIKDNIKGTKEE